MRQVCKDIVEVVANNLPVSGTIYEFGSLQVPGQEKFADLRQYFPNNDYIGCDMQQGVGVDRLENIEELSLPDCCASGVLCIETLEHVSRPWLAIKEMIRVLQPSGWMLIIVPFDLPIHNYPNDYYRYTPEALKLLIELANASNDLSVLTSSVGEQNHPHTVWALIQKEPLNITAQNKLTEELSKFKPDVVQPVKFISPSKRMFWKLIWYNDLGRARVLGRLYGAIPYILAAFTFLKVYNISFLWWQMILFIFGWCFLETVCGWCYTNFDFLKIETDLYNEYSEAAKNY